MEDPFKGMMDNASNRFRSDYNKFLDNVTFWMESIIQIALDRWAEKHPKWHAGFVDAMGRHGFWISREDNRFGPNVIWLEHDKLPEPWKSVSFWYGRESGYYHVSVCDLTAKEK